jgi:hypothetical protein
VPYICDGTSEEIEAASTVKGYCSDVIEEFQSETFRDILLDSIKIWIPDKAIILKIKCFAETLDDGSEWINSSYIEATYDLNNIECIIKIIAELFELPQLLFSVLIKGDEEIKNTLMKHDISYYKSCLDKIESISNSQERINARQKMKTEILPPKVNKLLDDVDKEYYEKYIKQEN